MGSVYLRGKTWTLKWRDGRWLWQTKASTAATKSEAKGLVLELERQAERQRLGLEPLPTDFTKTLAELCEWWLDERCPVRSRASELSRLTRHIITQPVGTYLAKDVTPVLIEDHLRAIEKRGGRGTAAASLNHLRKTLRAVYSRAIRSGLWNGQNPIDRVERRYVPRRAYSVLRVAEVPGFLEAVATVWRDLFAAALYTAMRKGEIFGLRHEDVDLERRIIVVRRSYDYNRTKSGRVEAIPISDPLLPYLKHAMERAEGSAFVFPDSKGLMRKPFTKVDGVLRRALIKAKIVVGWDHICRWCKAAKAPVHTWRRPDDELRLCPNRDCGKKLWARGIPRGLRFHDLRHTSATLLLRAGVSLQFIQRIVRHADISTTVETYGHLDVEDLRPAMELIAPILPSLGASLVQEPRNGSTPAGAGVENQQHPAVLPEWARLESNQRPLASEAPKLLARSVVKLRSYAWLGRVARPQDGSEKRATTH